MGRCGNLVIGPAGSGKSTTLATLVSEMQSKTGGRVGVTPSALEAIPSTSGANGPESGPDPFVLLHTFGLMGRSDDIRRVLLRLCAELKQRFNIYVDLPNTLQEVAGALPRFLAHAALFGKVVFILDGLDRADMRGFELHDYLPAALPFVFLFVASIWYNILHPDLTLVAHSCSLVSCSLDFPTRVIQCSRMQ